MAQVLLNNASIHLPIYGLGTRSIKKTMVHLATGGIINTEDQQMVVVKALDNITLKISDGTRLGIIGHNGAGKSTLLRAIAGIYEPSDGTISTQGSIATLLDLMLGIDEESTGFENIFLRCTLLGLRGIDIKKIEQDIADFTGLGDYLHLPLRTYSSGMRLRLAFAIATSIHAEILLIDEIAGAGDKAFAAAAKMRYKKLIDKSHILVLTSHDENLIKQNCDTVLWLEAGKIKFLGDLKEGLERYHQSTLSKISSP
jgi:lipopolysaccharide transport system ATP-binding protein